MRQLAGLATLLVLGACANPPRPVSRIPPPVRVAVPPRDVLSIPDAVPRDEPRSRYGNPASYEVFGQRYVVLATAAGFRERGIASWYGPDFHGRNTSSGETYDMYAMTAAHKTLPIPCYARVTNLGNGRSVVVRINDRGPFVAGRIIDLSYTAAAKLDLLRDGTAQVELQVLLPEGAGSALPPVQLAGTPPPDTAPAPVAAVAPGTYAQVGAYVDPSNLERVLARLRGAGLTGLTSTDTVSGRKVTRVRIGPIVSEAVFAALQAKLHDLGLGAARIVVD